MDFNRRLHPAGWAQQDWPHSDGWVDGGVSVGGCIVATVLDKGQQPLEKEKIGHKQLLSHPDRTGMQGQQGRSGLWAAARLKVA